MGAGFDHSTDALAIRLDALEIQGPLHGHRPIVTFVDQGVQGTPVAVHTSLERSHGPASSRLTFPLNRVVFVIDRSGSMGEPLHPGDTELKLDYIKRRIGEISENYFPGETKISLVYFDHNHTHHECGIVRQGGIGALKYQVSSLSPAGATEFSNPLATAARILKVDREQAKRDGHEDNGEGLRSFVFFLSDGQDSSAGSVTRVVRKLRYLNATTAWCGIGEDYSMSRILKFASNAGAATWSHVPLTCGEADVFDVQIPAIIRQLITEERYLQLKVSGSFDQLVAATPSIRGTPSWDSIISMGYQQSSAGIVFERPGRDDIRLTLREHRHATDRSPRTQDVGIVDAAGAGHLQERIQAAQNLVDRYLILEALRNRDVDLLKQMRDVRPDLAPVLNDALDDLRRNQKVDASVGSQSMHSAMSLTGFTQGLTKGVFGAWKKPGGPPESNSMAELHSGGVGPLSAGVPSYIAPAIQPNAAAYQNARQRQKPAVACVEFSPPLYIVAGTAQHVTDFGLAELKVGKSYVFGRDPSGVQGSPNQLGVQLAGSLAISRLHFRIFAEGEKYFIQDLGSRNGTFLNGKRLSPEVRV